MPRRHDRRAYATLTLIALNLAAWGAVAWAYGLSPLAPQNSALLLRAGAADGATLRAGELWRVVTSQFLHVHLPHLLFNMLALLLLGRVLERETGRRRLLVLYLGGGTVGQVAGVAATPELVSSGASQAIMALAGAAVVRLCSQTRERRALLVITAIYIAVQTALDLRAAGHVKAGHLAGFCAGALVGYFIARPRADA